MQKTQQFVPDKNNILQASENIRDMAHVTPVMTCRTLNDMAGRNLYFKMENFQKAGAFKYRGALHAVKTLRDIPAVAAHSSGNHAQALALAARQRGIPAYLVMPKGSTPAKVAAVRSYGGTVIPCENTLESREQTLLKVLEDTGSAFIHPYDDGRTISGQATCAREFIEQAGDLDVIVTPLGGGGLLSGTALSAYYFGKYIRVVGAEPAGADDGYRSFVSGTLVTDLKPDTIADGLRTRLSELTFSIIRNQVHDVVTVSEEEIIEAMRLMWERMKVVIEPSAAVPVAAMVFRKAKCSGTNVGIIVSGGNADLTSLPWKGAPSGASYN